MMNERRLSNQSPLMATSQNPNPNCKLIFRKEQRNWAELNGDVLMLIFRKVGMIDVLMSVGSVCRAWRKVTEDEPDLWRRIDMTSRGGKVALMHMHLANLAIGQVSCKQIELMKINLTKIAIDRSRGRIEQFWIEYFGDDDLLQYLCDRTSVLKSLRLISCGKISDEGIVETAKGQPLLEELEISGVLIHNKLPELVGEALPNLKQLNLFHSWHVFQNSRDEDFYNVMAFGIAKTMHHLRSLRLYCSRMSNKGLKAILEGCPHLETLDIRDCWCCNWKMDSDMCTRCGRLLNFVPFGSVKYQILD